MTFVRVVCLRIATSSASPARVAPVCMTYPALDGATYMLRLTVDMPEGIRGKSVMLTLAGLTKE